MRFQFRAFDRQGNYIEGIIEAVSREEALEKLQAKELLVSYLKPARAPIIFDILQKPKSKDLMLFTRQLSYLIQAKVSLDEAIKSLASSAFSKQFREVLLEIYEKIISGVTFSQALKDFPEVFDAYYIQMVKIGETSGNLTDTLNYLADHLEYQQRFKNRILQALMYPIMVLILFIGVLIALFYFVIPKITDLFVQNDIDIPNITKFFSSLSNILLDYGILLVFVFAGLTYFLTQYLRSDEGKVVSYTIFSKIPIIGSLIQYAYLGQFLESLYYLFSGGISLLESLKIISQSAAHPIYKQVSHELAEMVRNGMDLSEGLKRYPRIFPSIVVQAITTGEKTGQIREMLETMIKYYREEVENRSANLGEALQPILTIVLGAGLAALELSLLLPLLSLTKNIQSF